MRAKAYITGSRASGGYRLIMPGAMPAEVIAEFSQLQNAFFTRYRAAQGLATAINEYRRKHAPPVRRGSRTMRTIEVKLYQYDELPTERAKERARDWYREGSAGDNWFAEYVTEEFQETLKACGFDVTMRRGTRSEPAIYWALNPDCAGFDASWSASRVNVAALIADRPVSYVDRETGETKACKGNARLVAILERMRDFADRFPSAYGQVSTGRGASISETSVSDDHDDEPNYAFGKDEQEEFRKLATDLAHEFARSLSAEYEYQNSDEQVAETIRANEYEFTAEGERA